MYTVCMFYISSNLRKQKVCYKLLQYSKYAILICHIVVIYKTFLNLFTVILCVTMYTLQDSEVSDLIVMLTH